MLFASANKGLQEIRGKPHNRFTPLHSANLDSSGNDLVPLSVLAWGCHLTMVPRTKESSVTVFPLAADPGSETAKSLIPHRQDTQRLPQKGKLHGCN
jgi:hypothetical protein